MASNVRGGVGGKVGWGWGWGGWGGALWHVCHASGAAQLRTARAPSTRATFITLGELPLQHSLPKSSLPPLEEVRNFPSSRGTVVGLLKAGIGLSGRWSRRAPQRWLPGGVRAVRQEALCRLPLLRPLTQPNIRFAHITSTLPSHPSICCCPGSLFASVYSGVFAPARAPFLLFLGLGPLAVGLLALPFLNTCTFVQVCKSP